MEWKKLSPVMSGEAGTWHCNHRRAANKTNEKFRSSARDLIDALRKKHSDWEEVATQSNNVSVMLYKQEQVGEEIEKWCYCNVCESVGLWMQRQSVKMSHRAKICVCVKRGVKTTWSFEILTSASIGLLISTCPPSRIWQPSTAHLGITYSTIPTPLQCVAG